MMVGFMQVAIAVSFGAMVFVGLYPFMMIVLDEWDRRHEKAAENVKNVPPTKSDKGPLL